MEFGSPQRSATSDANAGVIAPPTKKVVARQSQTERQSVGNNQAEQIRQAGSQLGAVIAQRAEKLNAQTVERKALEAAARQGQDTAINNVDKMNKRTGWAEKVFGQTVEYRTAQQMAVKNSVRQQYLEAATTLDNHAAMTPDEFSETVLGNVNTSLAEKFEDKETKNLALGEWRNYAEKLSAKHYENHYAYAQQQAGEQFVQDTLELADQWTIEAGQAFLPEEKAEVLKSTEAFFKGETKPPSMSAGAWRNRTLEAIDVSLREGNIGLLNGAKAHGFTDNLSQEEQRALDTAISAYDTKQSHSIGKELAVAGTNLTSVETVAELEAGIQELDAQLDGIEVRTSGTERAEKDIAQARERAAKLREAGLKAFAKNSVKANQKRQLERYTMELMTGDVVYGASGISEAQADENWAASDKDVREAVTNSLMDIVGATAGLGERPSIEDAARLIAENPGTVGKAVAKAWGNTDYESDLVKNLGNAVAYGWKNMVQEEDLQPTEELHQLISATEQFSDDPKFRKTLGTEAYNRYLILKNGVSAKKTSDMIEREIENFESNSGKFEQWGGANIQRLTIGDNKETSRDAIKRVARELMGGNVDISESQTSEYMEQVRVGLQIHGNDWGRAKNYLKSYIDGDTVRVFGKPVQGASQLNTLTSKPFGQVMEGLDQTGLGAWVVTSLLGRTEALHGADGEPVTELSRVPGIQFIPEPGEDYFWVESPESLQRVRVSGDFMREAEEMINFYAVTKQEEQERKAYRENKHLIDRERVFAPRNVWGGMLPQRSK